MAQYWSYLYYCLPRGEDWELYAKEELLIEKLLR